MSDEFNTITAADWKRSIAERRARKNIVAEQIRTAIARPLFIPLKREFFEAFEGQCEACAGPTRGAEICPDCVENSRHR